MVVYTRLDAKNILDRNAEIAWQNEMTVVTVFHKDLITCETCLTDLFSHDSIQAIIWKNKYLEDLRRLGVPYACYLGDSLDSTQGELLFDKD